MSPSTSKLSKALLDLSRVSDVVLRVTAGGEAALVSNETGIAERTLLARIDGFRSVEQVLAISGDVISVHAALGRLVALGFVAPEGEPAPVHQEASARNPEINATKPAAAPKRAEPARPAVGPGRQRSSQPATPTTNASRPVPPQSIQSAQAAPATPGDRAKPITSELAQAKALLGSEAAYVFGGDIARFQRRIDACRSIEEIYDLIVKVQDHLSKTGKADPAVFLDRLTAGLASARAEIR